MNQLQRIDELDLGDLELPDHLLENEENELDLGDLDLDGPSDGLIPMILGAPVTAIQIQEVFPVLGRREIETMTMAFRTVVNRVGRQELFLGLIKLANMVRAPKETQ
jgi:hypothetical protein